MLEGREGTKTLLKMPHTLKPDIWLTYGLLLLGISPNWHLENILGSRNFQKHFLKSFSWHLIDSFQKRKFAQSSFFFYFEGSSRIWKQLQALGGSFSSGRICSLHFNVLLHWKGVGESHRYNIHEWFPASGEEMDFRRVGGLRPSPCLPSWLLFRCPPCPSRSPGTLPSSFPFFSVGIAVKNEMSWKSMRCFRNKTRFGSGCKRREWGLALH